MAESTQNEGEASGPGPSKARLVMTLLVGLAGGGAVGALYLGPMVGPVLAAAAEHAEETEPEVPQGGAPVHMIDNLVVNPAQSGGTRILLTSVAVETATAEEAARMATLDLALRAALIVVLASRTVEELTDVSIRSEITAEVFTTIDEVVGPGVVKRILIPQFVVQ